nr:arginine deiminase-related protein [uncultured Sediminibacterium sp.]
MATLPTTVILIKPNAKMGKPVTRAFQSLYELLQKHGVTTISFNQTADSTIGALYPACWLTTLPEGIVLVLPIHRRERREEKRDDILELLQQKYLLKDVEDWSEYEVEGFFLEGTASMVMDHKHKLIYAALSPRTHPAILEKFASAHKYKAITFSARDVMGKTPLHTNMLMHFGEDYVLLCEEAFTDDFELIAIKQLLLSTGYRIIPFQLDQLALFMGNSFSCKNNKGDQLIFMGEAAMASLTREQIKLFGKQVKIIPVPLEAIEKPGDAGLNAMLVPVWLQPK